MFQQVKSFVRFQFEVSERVEIEIVRSSQDRFELKFSKLHNGHRLRIYLGGKLKWPELVVLYELKKRELLQEI